MHKFLFLISLALVSMSQASARPLQVLACEPEWAALAQELGRERVVVASATTALQDPHHIEARPSLIAGSRSADLMVCTGANLEEGWLPVLQRRSGNPAIQIGKPGFFAATSYVSLLERPQQLDRMMGDIHAMGNPHIHLDPQRMLLVAKPLAARLAQIDPAHEAEYQNNLADFEQRWQAAMVRWQTQAKALAGKRIVVHHNSWVYLERFAGLIRAGTLEPTPGIPPSASSQAQLLEKLRDNPPDLIIYSGYQDARAARWLSRQLSRPAVAVPNSVSEQNGRYDLIGWYDGLLDALTKALTSG